MLHSPSIHLPHSSRGKLYLIGAGPGDPDLLTVKAVRVLGECDVILYDRLVNEGVLNYARAEAERIYVGKRQGEQEPVQAHIFSLILQHAEAGKVVGRVKGGDPFIFGRGAEEWSVAASHGIDVEFVPGVSSAVALPGLAGIPLTYRELSQSFAVVTGHLDETHRHGWDRYRDVDTLVILMGVKNRHSIAIALLHAGRSPDEPVAFIQHGSLPNERVILARLADVAAGQVEVKNPAVFVVGQVVKLRERYFSNSKTANE